MKQTKLIGVALLRAALFAVSCTTHAQTLTTLFSFNGSGLPPNYSSYPGNIGPSARPTLGSDGNFYGTTSAGGSNDGGTIFKITPTGTLTTIYSFSVGNPGNSFPDGQSPNGGLTLAADGNFYGVTLSGGSGYGTIFKITPTGALTSIYSFGVFNFSANPGNSPSCGLALGPDGNLYGTTFNLQGGATTIPGGAIFKVTPTGKLTWFYAFGSQGNNLGDAGPSSLDGAGPCGLTFGPDGNLYGTTSAGGAYSGGGSSGMSGGARGYGTFFKIKPTGSLFDPTGTLATLHSFSNGDGASPNGGLTLGADGNFYGTTLAGGSNNDGTIFKITPTGTLTTLHSFGNADGSSPYFGLVMGPDGNFYGTTSAGGSNNDGTIFKITPTGTFTVIHSFDGTDGSGPGDGYDGLGPEAGGNLTLAPDGSFYGTTEAGGTYNQGTLFKLALALPTTSGQSAIPLFSTGVYVTEGQDTSYQIVTDTTGEISAPAQAFAVTSLPVGWATIPGAVWVAPSADQSNSTRANCCLNSSDHYRITFSLADLNPSTTTLTLSLAADDYVDVLLNGQTVFTHPSTSMWSSPASFVVNSPFVAGTNTLDFLVSNAGGGPTGLIASIAGTANNSPYISPAGIVPIYSSVSTIQPGEWVSIYGSALASGNAAWTSNFPTSLGGASVSIDGKAAFLWSVGPTQINLQAPDDTVTGAVPVVVTTASGSATSTVTLGQFAPSLSLLDTKHVAGIILRPDGSGSQAGGTYDILGPTGNSLGYPTVAAKAGDSVELFGVGFGPTNPTVPAGQSFSGAAQTTNTVQLSIGGTSVLPSFSGLSSAGLYQLNVTIPAGLMTGDQSLSATVGGAQTQPGVVISLQ
jgi:uncharacterized protein (TIGR03437 family)